MNILFENIRIINPASGLNKIMNLWLKDGLINRMDVNKFEVDSDTKAIDGKNLICCPGLFDMHVHFRQPGFEYKETIKTGAMAAANGGFTEVVVMPNTDPAIDDPTIVEYVKNMAAGQLVNVHISAAISKGRKGESITPMLQLHQSGVNMFTDDGSCVMNSEVMRRAFDYAASKDLLIAQHCEDHNLTDNFAMNESALSYKLGLKGYPTVAEEVIVERDTRLAEYCGNRRYHVQHISAAGSLSIIRESKAKGLRVTCEVAPHHFLLDESILTSYDPNVKMNPPLRGKIDVEACLEGLKDGTIDCIATDHAPHALHEKDVEYENAPHGIIGLETSLGLCLTNLVHKDVLSLEQLIEKMSINPRKIMRLPEVRIEEGEKANLTIFDPESEWVVNKNEFKTKGKNTPFEGMPLKGKPVYAINNGMIFKSEL